MKVAGCLFIFILFQYQLVIAQKEDYVWRVGYFVGIDFNLGQADTFSVNKILPIYFSNASSCDSTGNLIIFANGINIFNALGDTMLNGDGLNPSPFTSQWSGGLPITQANIIIRRPEHPDQYYLFHETYNNTNPYLCKVLYQSVIDMSLDSGRGGVTTIKNFHLLDNDTLLGGKLSAVRHGNGRDWWLITKKLSYPIFYKWLIMPDTIIGPLIQSNQPAVGWLFDQEFGQVAFTPGGDKYAAIYSNKFIYLYDFDRCTGTLNHIFHEFLNDSSYLAGGVAFSSSGRYLYICTQLVVYQYDMYASNVQSSKTVVATYDGFVNPVATHFNQMRLAPDEKIYISTDNGIEVFHVIEFPDSAGLGCNVLQHSFELGGPPSHSVPNIPDYRLGSLTGSICDSLQTSISNPPKAASIQLNIFPIPATYTDELTFTYNTLHEPGEISVYNIDGKRIAYYPLPQWSSMQRVKLTEMAEGIYLARFKSKDQSCSVKFVVE